MFYESLPFILFTLMTAAYWRPGKWYFGWSFWYFNTCLAPRVVKPALTSNHYLEPHPHIAFLSPLRTVFLFLLPKNLSIWLQINFKIFSRLFTCNYKFSDNKFQTNKQKTRVNQARKKGNCSLKIKHMEVTKYRYCFLNYTTVSILALQQTILYSHPVGWPSVIGQYLGPLLIVILIFGVIDTFVW